MRNVSTKQKASDLTYGCEEESALHIQKASGFSVYFERFCFLFIACIATLLQLPPSWKVSEARGISGSKEPNDAFARTRSRGNITALKQLRAAPSTEAEILRQTDVEVDKGKQKHVRGNYKPGEKSPVNNLTLQCIQPCLVLCQENMSKSTENFNSPNAHI